MSNVKIVEVDADEVPADADEQVYESQEPTIFTVKEKEETSTETSEEDSKETESQ